MSGKFDITRWADAEDATEWHRSQVQGFLYRDDDAVKNDKRAGIHACRDLTRPSGQQTFWRREASHEEYEEAHQEMMRQIRLYKIGLTQNEYENPTPTASVAEDTTHA